MRKFSLKTTLLLLAFLGSSTAAFAADPGMAPSDWSGFYLGGNLGMDQGSWKFTYYDDQVPAGGSKTVSSTGLEGGLQAGYNFQVDNFVYGVEGDFQASSLKSDEQGGFSFDSCGCFDVSLNSFGTLRAKAGVLLDPSILLYATGGLILGDLSYTAKDSSPKGSATIWAPGLTVGGGAEFLVAPKFSIKAEGLYYNFGSPRFDLGNTSFNTNLDVSGYIARVGFNYHF